MKALVGTFNQEKVLVEAFSVIVETDGSFAALLITCNGIVLVLLLHHFSSSSLLVQTSPRWGAVLEVFRVAEELQCVQVAFYLESELLSVYLHHCCSFTSVPDPCALCDKVQSEEWKTPKVRRDVCTQVYRKCDDMFMCRCITTCTTGSSWAPAASSPSETIHTF